MTIKTLIHSEPNELEARVSHLFLLPFSCTFTFSRFSPFSSTWPFAQTGFLRAEGKSFCSRADKGQMFEGVGFHVLRVLLGANLLLMRHRCCSASEDRGDGVESEERSRRVVQSV